MRYRQYKDYQDEWKHPNAHVKFSGSVFMSSYVDLEKQDPFVIEAHMLTTYHCLGPRIFSGMKDHELRKAMEAREANQKALDDYIKNLKIQFHNDPLFHIPNEMIMKDFCDMFLGGEFLDINRENLAGSLKALSIGLWNAGNWRRGVKNWNLPSEFNDITRHIDYKNDHDGNPMTAEEGNLVLSRTMQQS